jgi:hypothetical protein
MDAQATLNELSQSVHLHHQPVKSSQEALYPNERLMTLKLNFVGGVGMNSQFQTRY